MKEVSVATTGCNRCVTWDTKQLHTDLLLVVILVTHGPKEPYVKTVLFVEQTSSNQNKSICHCDKHSCLVVWTVDVHQPKLFHNNNTKDGKERFRKDEF